LTRLLLVSTTTTTLTLATLWQAIAAQQRATQSFQLTCKKPFPNFTPTKHARFHEIPRTSTLRNRL
jgi:hypothetical protein